jgi:hypothetical protein
MNPERKSDAVVVMCLTFLLESPRPHPNGAKEPILALDELIALCNRTVRGTAGPRHRT